MPSIAHLNRNRALQNYTIYIRLNYIVEYVYINNAMCGVGGFLIAIQFAFIAPPHHTTSSACTRFIAVSFCANICEIHINWKGINQIKQTK